MNIELRKTFQIEAAHRLPHVPEGHKCRRLHGHSFQVEIFVSGECDPQMGWLIDYADISQAFRPLYEQLDHNCLNEVAPFDNINPSSENIATTICTELQALLQGTGVSVYSIKVYESPLSCITFFP